MSQSTGPQASTPDFGANEWLVEEMKERFDADPASVDSAWADYFGSAGSDDGGNGRSAAPAAKETPPEKKQPEKKEPAAKKEEPAKKEPAAKKEPERLRAGLPTGGEGQSGPPGESRLAEDPHG